MNRLSFKLAYSVAAGVVLLCLPLFLQRYAVHILILSGIYMIIAVGLSLVSGFAGQLSLGQAAFYAIGAYVSSLLVVTLGVPLLPAIIISIIASALMGVLVGLPTLRLSGVYLTVTTVGIGEIVRLVIMNWTSVTRGPMGVRGIPPLKLGSYILDTPFKYYYLVLAAVILAFMLARRIIYSRVGRAFVAVADNEVAAQTVGVNPTYYKTLAFVISAAYAGFAGSLYAYYIRYLHPDSFTQAESILAVTIIVVGGVRSLPGIAIASLIVIPAIEYLRAFSEFRLIVYALVLILSLIFMPNGIGGILTRLVSPRSSVAGSRESTISVP